MIVVHKNTDITEYVSSMSWGGSRAEVARKLELHIVNAPLDKKYYSSYHQLSGSCLFI